MKSLIAFSGGMDSTYVLWKCLSQTTDDVTAVFFYGGNLSSTDLTKYNLRSFTEILQLNSIDPASQAVVDWLKANVRDFTLIVEPLNTAYFSVDPNYPNNPQSYCIRRFVYDFNSGVYDQMLSSCERENDGWSNGGTTPQSRGVGSMIARELFVQMANRGRLDFSLIENQYNQAIALSELPQALLALVDTCAIDDMGFLCQKRRFFKQLLAEGKTQQEIRNIVNQNSITPDNRWMSMKLWLNANPYPPLSQSWDMPTWPSSYEVPSSG
jgi:hypothetical protein